MTGRELLLVALVGVAIALAAGCSSSPAVGVPEVVKVPTPTPCVDQAKRPARPPFKSDAELEQLDDYRWALGIWTDRARALDYVLELEAIVDGCSRIPAPRLRLGPSQ